MLRKATHACQQEPLHSGDSGGNRCKASGGGHMACYRRMTDWAVGQNISVLWRMVLRLDLLRHATTTKDAVTALQPPRVRH